MFLLLMLAKAIALFKGDKVYKVKANPDKMTIIYIKRKRISNDMYTKTRKTGRNLGL
jgi:hypothetical protein